MSKSYGIYKADYSGRFVLPAKLREELELHRDGMHFEVFYDGEIITLIRHQQRCVFCGRTDGDFKGSNGKHICLNCYNAL